MIIVRIVNGLGNQLFQYALGRRLALDRGVPLKLDLGVYDTDEYRRYDLNHFHIQAEPASRLQVALLRNRGRFRRGLYERVNLSLPLRRRWAYLEKRHFEYDPDVLCLGKLAYVSGYWQNPRYFEPIAAELRRELTFRHEPDAANQAMSRQIASVNAVSVHVRRGDYLVHGGQWLGTLSPDYYRRAARLIAGKAPNPHFFVFSDQPGWARDHLQLDYPTTVVDHNDTAHGYEDLRLMTHCRHHIIANSTLSWWGAWLAESPGQQVVAPTPWARKLDYPTPDMIPPGWHQIERDPGAA